LLTAVINALPTIGYLAVAIPVHRRDVAICKSPATRVRWAREELKPPSSSVSERIG
jgi:hypothetical protein